MPVDSEAETGYILLNFKHTENNRSFRYANVNEAYSNANLYDIVYSPNFTQHKDGDVYYFDYPYPQKDEQLGYYTPFQFLDVDFDQIKEFLINDWYQGQCGNHYIPHKISNGQLVKLDYYPLNNLINSARFSPQQRIISIDEFCTAFNSIHMVYSLKTSKEILTQFAYPPALGYLGRRVLKEYYENPTNIFKLDTLIETITYPNDSTIKYTYARNKGRIIKYKSENMND